MTEPLDHSSNESFDAPCANFWRADFKFESAERARHHEANEDTKNIHVNLLTS